MLNLTKKSQEIILLALIVIMVVVSSTVGATQAIAASPQAAPQASQRSVLFSDEFDAQCFGWNYDP